MDRALHNRGEVGEDTRRKILLKAAELNYKPNHAARALVRRKPLRLGALCPSQPDYFWDDVIRGLSAAADELAPFGVEVAFHSTGARDAEGEAVLAERMLAEGIDGLALAPSNGERLKAALARGIAAGTPVVILNNDIPELKRLCYVGADSLRAGRVAGGLLGSLMASRGRAVIVAGFRGLHSQQQRIEGIQRVLAERYPGIELVGILENFDDGQRAYQAVRDLLLVEADLGGLAVTNVCVGGVGQAVRDYGGERRVRVVGFDLAADTADLMRQGVVDATVCQSPYEQGYSALRILGRYLLYGEKPPASVLQTKLEVIVREMLDESDKVLSKSG